MLFSAHNWHHPDLADYGEVINIGCKLIIVCRMRRVSSIVEYMKTRLALMRFVNTPGHFPGKTRLNGCRFITFSLNQILRITTDVWRSGCLSYNYVKSNCPVLHIFLSLIVQLWVSTLGVAVNWLIF